MACRPRLLAPLAVMLAVTAGCGGSPTSPSAPVPQFPGMIGTWSGTEHFFGTVNGDYAEADCQLNWLIVSQVGGQFSGSFEHVCPGDDRSTGDVAGVVQPSGAITQHLVIVRTGRANCTRTALHLFEGFASGTTVSLRVAEELVCTNADSSSTVVRERRVSLTRV